MSIWQNFLPLNKTFAVCLNGHPTGRMEAVVQEKGMIHPFGESLLSHWTMPLQCHDYLDTTGAEHVTTHEGAEGA